MGDYDDARSVSRPAGAVVLDGVQVADTQQCVHCGRHVIARIGSGQVRGFCTRCHGFVCGPGCPAGPGCLPQEQRLTQREAQARQIIDRALARMS